MAGSDGLQGIALTRADVDDALVLSSDAGWNQTADDWAFFIEQGDTIGFRSAAGRVVATTARLPYGGGVGWVAMVLVDRAFRHRGLASLLVEGCVQALQRRHILPVLDATPAGQPVYRHLGFRAGFGFERWEGRGGGGDRGGGNSSAGATPAQRPTVRSGDAADLDAVAALDQAASGLGRRALLHDFLARADTRTLLQPDGSGFVVVRAGRRAVQLGPLVAADADGAIALLEAALGSIDAAAAVYVDVPSRWDVLGAALKRLGFSVQRSFVRMALGDAPRVCSDRSFALAGPEFG